MLVRLDRVLSKVNGTLGILHIDNFNCFTLEDNYTETKIPGETRIPAGTYDVKLRAEGGMHKKYLTRYSDFYCGQWWLQDVPDFEWIYIHPGNYIRQSRGCILPGLDWTIKYDEYVVWKSVDAYKQIYFKTLPALIQGKLKIEINDYDR